MMGAAPRQLSEPSVTGRVVAAARIPVVLVRAAGEPPTSFCRVLVALDGSVFSRAAAEFAFAYASAASADVTLLHVVNESRVAIGAVAMPESRESHAIPIGEQSELETHIRAEYESLAAGRGAFDVRVVASGDPTETIADVANAGGFDLLVLGAENKLLAQPLFFGQGTAAIVGRTECTTAVVIPAINRL